MTFSFILLFLRIFPFSCHSRFLYCPLWTLFCQLPHPHGSNLAPEERKFKVCSVLPVLMVLFCLSFNKFTSSYSLSLPWLGLVLLVFILLLACFNNQVPHIPNEKGKFIAQICGRHLIFSQFLVKGLYGRRTSNGNGTGNNKQEDDFRKNSIS